MPSPNASFLVVNCGSSSLKFGLFIQQSQGGDPAGSLALVAEGLGEALGTSDARISIEILEPEHAKTTQPCSDHASAIKLMLAELSQHFDLEASLQGVGHRVVHGGEHFKGSVIIDASVTEQISACSALAPLHNPANLEGIKLMQANFPEVAQVAVFDTAFHQTMPEHAFTYALPYELYQQLGVRRYGFHGTSHRYVSQRAAQALELDDGGQFICAHLGNGASVCAIKDGKSVDTSMGMTPLEGLVMGTRSGDIDPGMLDYLMANGYEAAEIVSMLNKSSGLLGISGSSNDMRTLVAEAEQGLRRSALAIDIFCFRLAKYIASMMASLSRLDGLIFTGGIGENAAPIREKTIAHLALLGFTLDTRANQARPKDHKPMPINAANSHPIMVIKTDEEKMIAQDTLELVNTRAAN